MKSHKIRFFKGVYLVSTFSILFIFAGISISSCKNHREEQLYAVFSLPEPGNITSLDTLDKDTLAVGTEQGLLYFYCPEYDDNPVVSTRVGNRAVYVTYSYKNDVFVGISDEGLKCYSKTGDSLRLLHQYHLGRENGKKNYHYAVYKLLTYNDTLFCATSCGLAMLDLNSPNVDSLQLLYHKPIAFLNNHTFNKIWISDTTLKVIYNDTIVSLPCLPDCKFNDISLSGDTLKVIHNDSVLSFVMGDYNKTLPEKVPHFMDSPWEETLSMSNITYKFKQGDNKFYAFSQEYIVPHNVRLVRQYGKSNNSKGSIVVITEDWSSQKNVYIGNSDGVRWDRKWSRCLSRDVPGQITDAVFFPNDSCLILTSSEKIYKGNRHGLEPLKFEENDEEMPDRAKCIFYSTDLGKLYVALGRGYTTYKLDNGNPKWETECFEDSTITARCFAYNKEIDKGQLYIGTLHDSCILKNMNDAVLLDTVNDIRDIILSDKKCFILTGDSLFVYSIDNTNRKLYDKLENCNVRKLCSTISGSKSDLYGISSKHVFLYQTDRDHVQQSKQSFNPTFGHINPFAIYYDSDHPLVIGTDKGLFVAKNKNVNNLHSCPIRDPFWKEYNVWSFVLAGVIVVALLVVLLIFRSKKILQNQLNDKLTNVKKEYKQRLEYVKNQEETKSQQKLQEELRNAYKDYENRLATTEQEKDKLISSLQNQALKHPYLNISSDTFPSVVDDSMDWVTKSVAKYKKEREIIIKGVINNADFTKETTVKDLQDTIDNTMLEYAFAAELFNLRTWAKEQDSTTKDFAKECYKKITNLNNKYVTRIITYSSNSRKTTTRDLFLHLWTIALVSDDEKSLIADNSFLTEYIELTEYFKELSAKKRSPDNPNHLRNLLKTDTAQESEYFKEHDKTMSDLYNTIKDDISKKLGTTRTSEKKKQMI